MRAGIIGLVVVATALAGCGAKTYSDYVKEVPPCPAAGLEHFQVTAQSDNEVTAAKAAFHIQGWNDTRVSDPDADGVMTVRAFCDQPK